MLWIVENSVLRIHVDKFFDWIYISMIMAVDFVAAIFCQTIVKKIPIYLFAITVEGGLRK